MKYTVIEASVPADLINLVNKYIENGWQPLGGVCRDRYCFYQAMTTQRKEVI